ncbi:BTAD domain-containing putative transcriptional regulator [Nisaea sp.]|uniref:BTAD domain-containing putative transcriptional regulator n=1 Tax=Nisaea sp. TaxID=2024842 RepID=UPI003266B050
MPKQDRLRTKTSEILGAAAPYRGNEKLETAVSTESALASIQLIGPMRAAAADGSDILPRGRKTRALFAFLCLARGDRVSRSKLAGLLWDRSSEQQAKTSLRQSLAELIAIIPEQVKPLLEVDREHLRLNISLCRIDVFDLLDNRLDGPDSLFDDLPEICNERLLEDFLGLTASFDQWLLSERARLGDTLRKRLEIAIEQVNESGTGPEVQVIVTRRLVRFDPTHEVAVRNLMKALVQLDDRPQASREFERCRQALRTRLDLAPSQETTSLYESLRHVVTKRPPSATAETFLLEPRREPGPTKEFAPASPDDSICGISSGQTFQDRPSVAVLPFVEYGTSVNETYFGDGVVEEIVSVLSTVPELLVISRISTLSYRQGLLDMKAVGEALGARYLLSGSVRRDRNRVRISAELCNAANQTVLWNERIEGTGDDLFELQDRIADRIIRSIVPHVRDAETRRALRKPPENLDAYDCFLRGLDALYRLNRPEFERAEGLFSRAAELDDSYAAPRAYKALWYSIRMDQGWSPDPTRDRNAMNELANAALERDQRDIAALAICGHVRALRLREYDSAIELFDRALTTSPNSALAWVRSSPAYSYMGDGAEARRRAEIALRLSPLDPCLFFTHCALGLAAYTSGDYDTAVAWHRRAFAGNPKFAANVRLLTASLSASGRIGEARKMAAQLLDLQNGFRVRRFCAGYAIRDNGGLDRFAAHLLTAGLPE